MNYVELTKNYTKEKKEQIISLSKLNKLEMSRTNCYNTKSLNYFFNLWHSHFPNNKQSKTCESCRKAVVKFCDLLAVYLEKEMIQPVPKKLKNKTKKVNAKAK
mgnify:CR=1 FL=1|tara:strand:+ start:198 stop:506 length:309 start_codon:yes stop_codon:yes gene_type:complete